LPCIPVVYCKYVKRLLVSPEDYDRLRALPWRIEFINGLAHAFTPAANGGKLSAGQVILDTPVGVAVHNKSWNKLDCRRCNLVTRLMVPEGELGSWHRSDATWAGMPESRQKKREKQRPLYFLPKPPRSKAEAKRRALVDWQLAAGDGTDARDGIVRKEVVPVKEIYDGGLAIGQNRPKSVGWFEPRATPSAATPAAATVYKE